MDSPTKEKVFSVGELEELYFLNGEVEVKKTA